MKSALPSNLDEIDRVTFYKRDELVTDLICCEILADGQRWNFHEEMADWDTLIAELGKIDGFRSDWYSSVSKPAFEECAFIAYSRIEP